MNANAHIHLFHVFTSFALKIFKSEHDVCCDCGVQVREADKYCRGSSQEWSALFLCVFVRLESDPCLALSLNHYEKPSIKTRPSKGGITVDFWIIKVHTSN